MGFALSLLSPSFSLSAQMPLLFLQALKTPRQRTRQLLKRARGKWSVKQVLYYVVDNYQERKVTTVALKKETIEKRGKSDSRAIDIADYSIDKTVRQQGTPRYYQQYLRRTNPYSLLDPTTQRSVLPHLGNVQHLRILEHQFTAKYHDALQHISQYLAGLTTGGITKDVCMYKSKIQILNPSSVSSSCLPPSVTVATSPSNYHNTSFLLFSSTFVRLCGFGIQGFLSAITHPLNYIHTYVCTDLSNIEPLPGYWCNGIIYIHYTHRDVGYIHVLYCVSVLPSTQTS